MLQELDEGCFSSFETTFLWCFKHKVLLICGGNLKSGCLRLDDAADDGDTETFFTWCCRSVKVDHKERYCTSLLYLSLRMLLQHMRREDVQRSEKFKVLIIIIILYRQIWRWWLWGLFPAATYTACCNILLKSPYNILQFFCSLHVSMWTAATPLHMCPRTQKKHKEQLRTTRQRIVRRTLTQVGFLQRNVMHWHLRPQPYDPLPEVSWFVVIPQQEHGTIFFLGKRFSFSHRGNI